MWLRVVVLLSWHDQGGNVSFFFLVGGSKIMARVMSLSLRWNNVAPMPLPRERTTSTQLTIDCTLLETCQSNATL